MSTKTLCNFHKLLFYVKIIIFAKFATVNRFTSTVFKIHYKKNVERINITITLSAVSFDCKMKFSDWKKKCSCTAHLMEKTQGVLIFQSGKWRFFDITNRQNALWCSTLKKVYSCEIYWAKYNAHLMKRGWLMLQLQLLKLSMEWVLSLCACSIHLIIKHFKQKTQQSNRAFILTIQSRVIIFR